MEVLQEKEKLIDGKGDDKVGRKMRLKVWEGRRVIGNSETEREREEGETCRNQTEN